MLLKNERVKKIENTYLYQYYDEIRNGRIFAGVELWTEITKLLADIDSEKYVYDTKDADYLINFMENCIKLTKSPFYGKPMKLMLWEKAFLEPLYSFKMEINGERVDRFKRAMLMIARKNGKSSLLSGLGFAELCIGGMGQDIVVSSADDNLTNIIYEDIDEIRRFLDPENKDTWRNQKCIKTLYNGNKVFKLTNKMQNKEGRNIDKAFIDEVHEFMSANNTVKPIEQSTSLKKSPKIIMITTEGFRDGEFLDQELIRCRKVLTGEDDTQWGERYLIWLYTQDSEQEVFNNPETWQKSNPSLGIVKRTDYLEEQLETARRSKADRAFVLAKDFNIKVLNSQAWFEKEEIDKALSLCYNLKEISGEKVYGGVDLAETTDLTAACILYEKEGSFYIHSHYWIPSIKLEMSNDKEFGAEYDEWIKKGYITVVEGAEVKSDIVADWYADLYRNYKIIPVITGYDQRFAQLFIKKMEDYGLATEIIVQNRYVLSTPMRLLETLMQKGKIYLNGNEVTGWCAKNSAYKVFEDNLQILCKQKGKIGARIDGIAAILDAIEVYRRNKGE